MREFDNIKDMVYCEIDEISHQSKLDMNSLKALGELVDILKDIGSVEMFEEGIEVQDDDYSQMNNYSRNGGYSQRRMPIYYNDGNSYRNGRGMGNGYSRRGRGYSYDGDKDHMIEELNRLMMKASDQNDKVAIQRLIEQMENN